MAKDDQTPQSGVNQNQTEGWNESDLGEAEEESVFYSEIRSPRKQDDDLSEMTGESENLFGDDEMNESSEEEKKAA